MENGTSAQVRTLVAAIAGDPSQLPVAEIVDIAQSQSFDVIVDLSDDPTVVYTRPRRHQAFRTLTQRELEVATLLAAGYSNRQVATALYISVATVKDHVHAILTKTRFENRSQIAAAWLGAEVNGGSEAGRPSGSGHDDFG